MSDEMIIAPLPASKRFKDLTGQVFSRLAVISYAGMRKIGKQNGSFWNCRCECGNLICVYAHKLIHRNVGSCGCWKAETWLKAITKHGESFSPELMALKNAMQRCGNPKSPEYPNYGGRGIRVCQEWIDDIRLFIDHIGRRVSDFHSLDRIDVNGNYEPGNVRWATATEQMNNYRKNIRIVIDGVAKTPREWSQETGFPIGIIYDRYSAGWPANEIISVPHGSRRPSRQTHTEIKNDAD